MTVSPRTSLVHVLPDLVDDRDRAQRHDRGGHGGRPAAELGEEVEGHLAEACRTQASPKVKFTALTQTLGQL
jgi:hypothetical protein